MVDLIEAAEIVQTEDVVGMGVRNEDGLKVSETGAESLETELGGRVDEDVLPVDVEQSTGTITLITRVEAGADGTVAGDHGDALTGAGAEECQFDGHGAVVSIVNR